MQVKQLVVAVLTPLISGAATFGALALHHYGLNSLMGSGRVHAAAQSSPNPDALLANWPQQCEALKQGLLSQPELASVTYEARPIDPFVTPAWKLTWQGEVIALPIVDYRIVQVARNDDGKYFVLLESPEVGARVMLNQLKQPPSIMDVFATAPHPSLSLAQLQAAPVASSDGESEAEVKALATKRSRSRNQDSASESSAKSLAESPAESLAEAPAARLSWDGPSLTERLFDGPVALEQLIDEGYRHRPQTLNCKADAWEKELPIAMGLALKLSTGNGMAPEAAYANIAQQPGRLLKYRSEDKTTWQARFGAGEVYSNVTITLPSNHESAAAGLGMGQENWWDAEPRPEWLEALERAVEADTPYAWQALSVELQRAGMSQAGIRSIQQAKAE